jgi:antitoxin (DNA-binding transcriptional repressor) of toxin-antitoxin stability system
MAALGTISHHELVDSLSAVLRRAEVGEHFLITMDGRPVARLRPFIEPPPHEGDAGAAGNPSSNRPDT